MNSHIPTLLLREWMQHKRGWLITAFAPPLLFLALLPFGQVQGMPSEHKELVALAILMVSASAVFAICLLVALFQMPGLARRDVQDRSIEFWLSLPGRPSESLAATVLAHAWLAPLGGAIVGTLFGLPIAMSLLAAKGGMSEVAGVNWGEVVAAALPLLLWLTPLIFVLMAASAWLKRLGVPVVLVGGLVIVLVLNRVYDIGWPIEALIAWKSQLSLAILNDAPGLKDALMSDTNLWVWAMQDFGRALAQLASLQFLGWAAVAAAGFALVVAKRSRAG